MVNQLLDDLVRDANQALRAMRRAPLFTFIAVLTLGLGIGSSTAVFTIVITLLLNPLPARDPSALAAIYTTPAKSGRQAPALLPTSYLNLQDIASKNTVFSALAGYTPPLVLTLKSNGGQQRLFGELVTAQYFGALGIVPAKGRFFMQSEDITPGSANVAVLSHGAWRLRFGSAPDIVGRGLDINGVPFTVIGVAPAGFIGMSAVFGPDVWLPATMAQQVLPAQSRDALTERGRNLFHAIARLKRGTTRQEANTQLQSVAAALAREYPQTNEN
ncbi:MAG: ABC transporter permease, partial [Acidobacteriaceae bacterium]|nr:ABC transporter permease [Acidobacteriaceae bacterium]